MALHAIAPIVHFEYNTICISVFESKIVNPRAKHICIPVGFLQEQFYSDLLLTKYEKYSVMPEDMYIKTMSRHNYQPE